MPAELRRRVAAAVQRRLGAASRPTGDKPATPRPFKEMAPTLKRVSATLRDAGVEHALTGAPACWVFGAPDTGLDWDLVILPEDADRAEEALLRDGLRVERRPEGWLLKVWDADVLVDLIFDPLGAPVAECLARATTERVVGMPLRVLDPADVLTSMLLARNEVFLEFERLLQVARPIREHVDWERVRRGTAGSPYAVGFLALLDALGVTGSGGRPATAPAEVADLPRGPRGGERLSA